MADWETVASFMPPSLMAVTAMPMRLAMYGMKAPACERIIFKSGYFSAAPVVICICIILSRSDKYLGSKLRNAVYTIRISFMLASRTVSCAHFPSGCCFLK